MWEEELVSIKVTTVNNNSVLLSLTAAFSPHVPPVLFCFFLFSSFLARWLKRSWFQSRIGWLQASPQNMYLGSQKVNILISRLHLSSWAWRQRTRRKTPRSPAEQRLQSLSTLHFVCLQLFSVRTSIFVRRKSFELKQQSFSFAVWNIIPEVWPPKWKDCNILSPMTTVSQYDSAIISKLWENQLCCILISVWLKEKKIPRRVNVKRINYVFVFDLRAPNR